MERQTDIQQMIEQIRASAGFENIQTERDWDGTMGKYDGTNDDAYLAYVLDFGGEDYADESTGSTEWSRYVQRFGRVLMYTDDRGFVFAQIMESEHAAKEEFNQLDNKYCEWWDREEDEGGW